MVTSLESHQIDAIETVPFTDNPNIQPLPFDLAKANQILDSLGYAKGPNGIRMAGGTQWRTK
jgi:ABC-type transport system substrate-binding protein